MKDLKIIEVLNRRQLRSFISFPDKLYKDCPQYVPALHSDQVKSLTKVSTLKYCTRKMWLAVSGKEVVGRICAMINPRYNERYGTRRARFGWFDTVDDFEVAKALIQTAEGWAKEQGMTEIHGPLYYNTLGKQGMLVEGFENIPPFNCLYNFPYYNDFVTRLGYEKECDWVQYLVPADAPVLDKVARIAAILRKRYNLKVGSIAKLKKDKAMVRHFFDVYNESFSETVYNFIPFTDEEIEEEAASVMPFLSDKTSVIIQDENDQLVAFGICFPSISKALQRAKGKLFPFGWVHLLHALRHCETMDLMINGAAPSWQNKGVSAIYHEIMSEHSRQYGIHWAVTNPQIESNSAANVWSSYDSKLFMRRRCYLKALH